MMLLRLTLILVSMWLILVSILSLPSYAQTHKDTGGTLAPAVYVIGAGTSSVTVSPSNVSGSTYGTNYVVGGLLTFPNIFASPGSGVVQSIHITGKVAWTTSLKLYLFSSATSATTWTDNAVAAINVADVPKVIGVYMLSPDNGLGTDTIWNIDSIGKAVSIGSTTLYGVLVTSAALSATTGSTTDFTVTISTLKD